MFSHLGVLVQGGAAGTILLQHQHFTCCLPAFLCQHLYTFHTLQGFPQSHFDCTYIVREISDVALIFFKCVSSLSVFITFSKFIHAKERIHVGYLRAVMSLFKATDSFYLENLCVLGR